MDICCVMLTIDLSHYIYLHCIKMQLSRQNREIAELQKTHIHLI